MPPLASCSCAARASSSSSHPNSMRTAQMNLTRSSACGRATLPRSSKAPNPLPDYRRRRLLGSTSTSTSCQAGLKLTESFDAHLPLDDEKREALFSKLSDPNFCAQVSLETTQATKAVEFTGKVFTPVPWSPATPKGMPAEYEEFADDPETYIVINVPPTLTFKANVLGKRVCAIYKKVGDAE